MHKFQYEHRCSTRSPELTVPEPPQQGANDSFLSQWYLPHTSGIICKPTVVLVTALNLVVLHGIWRRLLSSFKVPKTLPKTFILIFTALLGCADSYTNRRCEDQASGKKDMAST